MKGKICKFRMPITLSLIIGTFVFFVIVKWDNPKGRFTESVTSIKLLNRYIDLGDVNADTIIGADYFMINTGENELHVKYINPDCSCTKYESSSNTISPRDTLRISLYVNTKNKMGSQKLSTVIRTNTSEQFHKITLKFRVKEAYQQY